MKLTTTDYLPHAYSELTPWLSTFVDYLKKEHLRFGISEAEMLPFINEAEDFLGTCEKAGLPNADKKDIRDRGWKKEYIVKTIRPFVNTRLRYNRAVTTEDRRQLGLSLVMPGHASAPIRTDAPENSGNK
jgi:hypothetical protein